MNHFEYLPRFCAAMLMVTAATFAAPRGIHAQARPAAPSPAMAPGLALSGYDWSGQWVTAKSNFNCTKNTSAEYSALLHLGNAGTSGGTVAAIELLGADADSGYFRFDNTTRSSDILPGDEVRPNDTLWQRVVFTPTEERVYSAVVQLTDSKGNVVLSHITGAGVESHGSITGIDFDTVTTPGTASPRRSVVIIRAMPTRALIITSVDLQGADAGDFQIDPADLALLPITLMPGQADSFFIEFHPATTTPGLRSAKVSFTGDQSLCDDSANIVRGSVGGLSVVDAAGIGGGFGFEAGDAAGNLKSLRYTLSAVLPIRIEIFDNLGVRVAVLADGLAEAGAHTTLWDPAGQPGGIYYCTISAGRWSRNARVIVRR